MILISELNFSEKRVEKIEKFFSNLKNYGEFFEEGEFKSNEAGTMANLRLPYSGEIVSLKLTKEIVKNNNDDVIITVYSKEMDSAISMEIMYFRNTHISPNISIKGDIYFFNTYGAIGGLLNLFFNDHMEEVVKRKIKAKLKEVAYS